MTGDPAGWRVAALLGFSSLSPTKLVELALGPGLTEAPGDVVLVAERVAGGATETMLATSGVAARPYYWTRDGRGGLHHGADVFAVARAAGHPWEWDPAGLQQLALMGHTLGATSLHSRVARLAPDTVVRWLRGIATERRGSLWDEPTTPCDPDQARDAFVEALSDILADGREPVVSLSAGFDSRALLAGALHLGARPRLLTMGHRTSTDRVVAAHMAKTLGLPHDIVELDPSEYLAAAHQIVRATSGTKLASHWHTYLYSRATQGHHGAHLVGSNGEYARSFYADKGVLSTTLNASGRAGLQAQWALKARRWSARTVVPLPARDLAVGGLCDQLVAAGGRRRPMDSLDAVYTTQRVRHFVGNGLALYALNGRPASPFLDSRWVRTARGLSRRQKLGSRWHRSLILALGPGLADFEIEARRPMRAQPPRAYWLTRPSVVGYSPFAAVLARAETRERILESEHLDELFTRQERRQAVEGGHAAVMELMLTLSYAAEHARSSE